MKDRKDFGSFVQYIEYLEGLCPSPFHYYWHRLIHSFCVYKPLHGLANCPFHNDYSLTLSMNLRTGEFICYECGMKGSSIIDFEQCLKDMSIEEALLSLAKEDFKNV